MIKSKNPHPSFSAGNIGERTKRCAQYPAFSFRFMTTQKKHTFDYYKNNRGDKRKCTEALIERLQCISTEEWKHWHGLEKSVGAEALPARILNVNPYGYKFSADEKFIVFRFKTGSKDDARIIGFRQSPCPTLHVFAFDFDFSAYPHGS